MRSKVWFLGLHLLFGAAEAGQDDAKNDVGPLQGGWTMVLVFINGEELPADQVKSGELIIEDDQYRAKLGANASTSTIKVDSSKTPKEIDLTYTAGDQKGKTVKGIYKMAGDDLTICRGLTEKEARPTEFAAPVDSGLLLVIWKRSKTVVSAKGQGDRGRAEAVQGDLAVRRDRGPGPEGSRKGLRERHPGLEGQPVHLVRRGKGGPRRLQDRPARKTQDDRHHLHRRARQGP